MPTKMTHAIQLCVVWKQQTIIVVVRTIDFT